MTARNGLKTGGELLPRLRNQFIQHECECGCGDLVISNDKSRRPIRFIRGHHRARLKHGGSKLPEYAVYSTAKARCRNPNGKYYKDYGGRGIEFRFTSFEEFYAELGPRPEGMTLDRKDNNGHYEPGNVRWATYTQQVLNRRITQRETALRRWRKIA